MNALQPIATDQAPQAIGPYSQGVATDGLLFISGQLPIDPATMQLIAGDIRQRTEQIIKNIAAIAAAAGTDLGSTVKITLFLTDMNDFPEVNAVYATFFTAPYPARSTVQVAGLPLGSNIEAEAIISLPRD